MLFFISLFSQAQITFQKSYDNIIANNSSGSWGATVLQTQDSGFALIGECNDTIYGTRTYLIKTDKYGDTLWTKIYNACCAFTGIQTSDGGFAFCGGSIIFKTNSTGDTLWTKSYNDGHMDYLTSLQQTSDGGFILAGYGGLHDDFLFIKIDAGGNLQWAKYFGGSYHNALDRAFSVFETNGTGYIAGGFTESYGSGSDDFYVVKTDLLGNLIWSKTYGASGVDAGNCMQKTNDGGFVLAGLSESFSGSLDQDIFIIKIDSIGNLIWSKDYDFNLYDWAMDIYPTKDNGFIVINRQGNCAIKTDMNGDALWTKRIDTTATGYRLRQTFDGGYVMLGTNQDYGYHLIKTDSLGNSCLQKTATVQSIPNTILTTDPPTETGIPNITVTSLHPTINSRGRVTDICQSSSTNELSNHSFVIQVFPNPFNVSATVNLNRQPQMNNGEFIMDDVFGREVKKLSILNYPFSIQRGDLPCGIYFYKVSANGKILGTGKVITE